MTVTIVAQCSCRSMNKKCKRIHFCVSSEFVKNSSLKKVIGKNKSGNCGVINIETTSKIFYKFIFSNNSGCFLAINLKTELKIRLSMGGMRDY